MKRLLVAISIFRLNNCILGSLAVFIPLAVSSGSIVGSLMKSLPLLFIGMCTYIINDLEDIEKDRVNHPERALPSNALSETMAASLYFLCLGIALAIIRILLDPREAWLYYLGLVLVVNYNYVVEYFPNLKSVYVAITAAVPMLIVAQNRPNQWRFLQVALAIFLFTLGRELCKDIQDIPGDQESLARTVNPEHLAVYSFMSQGLAIIVLTPLASTWPKLLGLTLITVLYAMAIIAWFRSRKYTRSTHLMKIILFIGLIFLL